MRLAGRLVLLVALWLLAWGEVSLANVVSGFLVAGALLIAFPLGAGSRERITVHPIGMARLVAYVVQQLLVSNVVMARTILRGGTSTPGVVDHRLARPSEQVVTFMTSIIALSPGTMTVDVAHDSTAISVHFFSLDDADVARDILARLERLVVAAIPTKEQQP